MSHFRAPRTTDNYAYFMSSIRSSLRGEGFDRDRFMDMLITKTYPYWHDVWMKAHDAMTASDALAQFWQGGNVTYDALMDAHNLYAEPAQCFAIVAWLRMAIQVEGFLDRFIAEVRAEPVSEDDIPTLRMQAVVVDAE